MSNFNLILSADYFYTKRVKLEWQIIDNLDIILIIMLFKFLYISESDFEIWKYIKKKYTGNKWMIKSPQRIKLSWCRDMIPKYCLTIDMNISFASSSCSPSLWKIIDNLDIILIIMLWINILISLQFGKRFWDLTWSQNTYLFLICSWLWSKERFKKRQEKEKTKIII